MTEEAVVSKGPFRLAASVGGSKCAFAVVCAASNTILARSRRVEWTRLNIAGLPAFVAFLAAEFQRLCAEAEIDAARIVEVGLAWPGPQVAGAFLATFIPGCQVAQPVPRLVQETLAQVIAPRLIAVPVHVVLDAVARACGETTPGGALHPPKNDGTDLLVNIATGIAAGLVQRGRPLLRHESFGANYGQFGRFLFLNRATGTWDWRATADGSVPHHAEEEVRWTELSSGPALARRIALLCAERGIDGGQDPAVAAALLHYGGTLTPRDAAHEKVLLRWATAESSRSPGGPLAEFVGSVAEEIGSALRVLLDVFAPERVGTVALAGGVGENFGIGTGPTTDPFLGGVRLALGSRECPVFRARLGVDAEYLGLGIVGAALGTNSLGSGQQRTESNE